MSIPPFFSFTLLLPLLLLCYTCSFYSTLLLLVLPTLLPFIFSKIKQLPSLKLGHNSFPEYKEAEEEEMECKDNEAGCNDPSMENDSPTTDESVANENLEHMNSECSISNDQDYSSDDESLIEIALDKHEPDEIISQQETKGGLILPDFFPEYLPELFFRKHRLMDFLAEINEEENMIEIDIAVGSIKCSRFEFKA